MMDKRKLYQVKIQGGRPGTLHLAIGAKYLDGSLQYHDTIRGHNIKGQIQETRDGFVFTPEGKETWTFTEVTIEEFNERIRSKVEGGSRIPKLKTTADLHEWYRRKFINP